jgi:hypothetical protein
MSSGDIKIIKMLVNTIKRKKRKNSKNYLEKKMNNSLYLHFNTENECDIFIKYSFYNFNFKFGNRCCDGKGIQVIFI